MPRRDMILFSSSLARCADLIFGLIMFRFFVRWFSWSLPGSDTYLSFSMLVSSVTAWFCVDLLCVLGSWAVHGICLFIENFVTHGVVRLTEKKFCSELLLDYLISFGTGSGCACLYCFYRSVFHVGSVMIPLGCLILAMLALTPVVLILIFLGSFLAYHRKTFRNADLELCSGTGFDSDFSK